MNTIKGMIEDLNNKDTHIGGCTTVGELIIALERLQMLEEQQPCEDCISREQALRHRHIIHDDDGIGYSVVRVDEIIDLPSVQPQPKRGYWEDCSNGWMCSNCYRDVTYESDFCPNCGADMRKEKADGKIKKNE